MTGLELMVWVMSKTKELGVHRSHPGRFDMSGAVDNTKQVKITRLPVHSVFTVRLQTHTHDLAIDICPSVCLSVRPSVKRVYCDKTR